MQSHTAPHTAHGRDARTTNVIIVGSGIAGLVAALRAEKQGFAVTVVTKGELAESNTRYAQGGIAAAVFDDDTVAAHAMDTMLAGAGLSLPAAVEVLCTEGPERIRDLIAWGVAFDRFGDSYARGLEAAHSSARVLHAGGDSTGAAIEWALVDAVRASGATVIEHAFVTELERSDDRVTGVEILLGDGTRTLLRAEAVVLATGGAGQLYPHTTNPLIATGDGVALAVRAGAAIRDLEFFQFHPTALAIPGSFLVSEAVRGEGATLLNERGERFMTTVHPDAELAPRDIVARAMATEMAAQGGTPVSLDATGLGRRKLAERFPTIDAATRAAGFDWSHEPIPVTPAAHYWMGGIATDLHGRTSVPGLFAIGEVANTGVHGANRLASNSLLEGAVFGWRVVEALSEAGQFSQHSIAEVTKTFKAPEPDSTTPVTITREELQSILWRAVGLRREHETLLDAGRELASATMTPTPDGSVREHEDRNLLDVARALVAAAQARRESRGAHYRSDFPELSAEFARPLAWAREERINAYQ